MNINLDQALVEKVAIHENLSQDIVVISTDRVKLILIEHHRVFKKKYDWMGPVGIFLTVLTTVLTADFKVSKFGIPAQMWQGIFLLAGFISLIWSLVVIINAIICRNEATVEEFVVKLRSSSVK